MNLQDHQLILALLACTAVLGIAVGYCVEVLRSSSREAQMTESFERERGQLIAAVEKQKESAKTIMAAERKSTAQSKVLSTRALARHDTLQMHTEVQANQIANLTAELRAAEEQNVKLQSDFAAYKSNKERELDMHRAPQRVVDEHVATASVAATADSLPVLSKRVAEGSARTGDAPIAERLASNLHASMAPTRISRKRAIAKSSGFDAFVPDADIPILAESELNESAEELDFAKLLGSDDEIVTSG